MNEIKSFVITIVTVIIFISSIEIIIPDSKMNKYINFILGLILIIAILNPIVSFMNNGQSKIMSSVNEYQSKILEQDETLNNNNNDKEDIRENSFRKNFNKNLVELLKKKFSKYDFEVNSECDINFDTTKFNIKMINVIIKTGKVKPIKKVELNDEKNLDLVNERYKDVVDYLKEQLQIDENKIRIYEK
ncbi:stage III sporulation protein AF [Clostridium sp. BJN0001]|uniref:stage III sporulation protein AF n=1 Tax=Clostridium sp. BJN0001 TaxID=2930219 RepID=UPI001FD3DA7A|nr:stage III sporulation protein AF [Clostridium sp. BJN0001]